MSGRTPWEPGEMKRRMLAGDWYIADDPALAEDHRRCVALLGRLNREDDPAAWGAITRELLGSVGDGALVRPPFSCDYGHLISLGPGAFLNFGCCILDVAEVSIGAATQIGPGVQIACADHPLDPVRRRAGWERGLPVRLGENVWVGAGAVICPGVTIGDDAVVGAGAVVTRDVAAGAIAVGVPARPRAGPPPPGR